MRTVRTYDKNSLPIKLGTRKDDGRYPDYLMFVQTGDGTSRRSLTREQALRLADVLVETANELNPEAPPMVDWGRD